jgi:protein-tyrosine-phosphatase
VKNRPRQLGFFFAAAVFARVLPRSVTGEISTASAGFIGPNRSSPEKALAAGRRYGVEMSSHRSALFTSESLKSSDLIVVMSGEQGRGIRSRVAASTPVLVLGDLDPMAIEQRTILDPWDGEDVDFEVSFGRIDRCIRELIRLMSESARNRSLH